VSKAVVFESYGGPEVLRVVDQPVPRPGPGQVRVAVRAAGVQPADALLRSGRFAQWSPATFPQRLGNEFAGVVDALGEGVTDWAVGDEVIGWVTPSAYAEHLLANHDEMVAKPAAVPWPEAGVLSASGQTAASVLTQLGVGPGDVVLIHAAAGGVGSYAVQLAAARGATVVGTASEHNHGYLRSLGAIPVAYGTGLASRVRAVVPRVDVALDGSGTLSALNASLELLGSTERIATIAYLPAARTDGRSASSRAEEMGIRRLSTRRSQAQLTELASMMADGRLTVEIQARYPLAEAVRAHHDIETRHVRGKVVLLP
jgi:enoyl reductase